MMQKFKVGVGKINITPDQDLLVSGGLYPRTFEKIKDPLFVKSIVICTADIKFAIITLDLLYLLNVDVVKIKKHLQSETDILYENIVICPSHTHSGPYTNFSRMEEYVTEQYEEVKAKHDKYMRKVHMAILQAVLNANKDLKSCKLGVKKGHVKGISHNRRVLKENNDCWNTWLLPEEERNKWPSAGPIDTDLYVLAAITDDNKVKAVLYNYGLHANSNHTTRSISADYPAYVAQEISRRLGAQEVLFIPGPCGNINANLSSEMIGKRISEEIVEVMNNMNYNLKPFLSTKSVDVELPLREVRDFQEEEISRKWPSGMDYYKNEYKKMIKQKQTLITCTLTGIRVDDNVLIFNPAELFVEFGLQIKEGSPFEHTIVVELANGYIGYVPTKEAFDQGGYETFYASQSKLIPEAGEIIVKESLNIVHELRSEC
jgi:neutral ceramidase